MNQQPSAIDFWQQRLQELSASPNLLNDELPIYRHPDYRTGITAAE